MISTWIKRALLIPAGALLFGTIAPANADAGDWRYKAHKRDRIEDRLDRYEDRRDRRVNHGRWDRIDRLENRFDRRHGPRASRYSSRYERKLNRKVRRLNRRLNGYRPYRLKKRYKRIYRY